MWKSKRAIVWVMTGLGLTASSLTWAASPARSASIYRTVKVATATGPIAVVWHPTTKKPYVVEQKGYVKALDTATKKTTTTVLNVSKEISSGGEQGLLGAAFSSDGSYLYVNLTNGEGDTEVREYEWVNGSTVATSKRIVIEIDQPYGNHNGGHVLIDSDGVMWIGMGDGGSSGDPENRAQDPTSLLGKMLRITPRPDGTRAYGIPTGNMYTDGSGKPEIWAIGLRNPWRYDIDEAKQRIFIGDVGQNAIEEVNVAPSDTPGANFGWKLREGTQAYNGGTKPAGALDPFHEYKHEKGNCSVTGGVVYRGKAVRGLNGAYLFGDFCSGWVAIATQRPASTAWSVRKLGIEVKNLSSFNRAPDGEVWITSTSGSIVRIAS
jgi:glucose/arabinose dehydrogenase